jgi:hypothetical protein
VRAGGPPPPGGGCRAGSGTDPVSAARDVLARAAEAEHPGWRLSHGLHGWTAVRGRDGRTLACGSLPGIRALMSVAGR